MARGSRSDLGTEAPGVACSVLDSVALRSASMREVSGTLMRTSSHIPDPLSARGSNRAYLRSENHPMITAAQFHGDVENHGSETTFLTRMRSVC